MVVADERDRTDRAVEGAVRQGTGSVRAPFLRIGEAGRPDGRQLHFLQGKLDKFFLGASGSQPTAELDLMTAAKILKPADPKETRQSIPRQFYELLDKNKGAFVTATTADAEQAAATHRGSPSDAYILKRLKDKAVRRCQQFTEIDQLVYALYGLTAEEIQIVESTAK